MTLRSHLTRRGSRYYFRQRVPTDLTERLGLKEIRKSLQSSSPQEAARRVLAVSALHAEFFERIRAMADDDGIPEEKFALNHALIVSLSRHWHQLGKAEADRDFAAYRRAYALVTKHEKNRAVEQVQTQVASRVPQKPAPAVSAFLELSPRKVASGMKAPTATTSTTSSCT